MVETILILLSVGFGFWIMFIKGGPSEGLSIVDSKDAMETQRLKSEYKRIIIKLGKGLEYYDNKENLRKELDVGEYEESHAGEILEDPEIRDFVKNLTGHSTSFKDYEKY